MIPQLKAHLAVVQLRGADNVLPHRDLGAEVDAGVGIQLAAGGQRGQQQGGQQQRRRPVQCFSQIT